MNVSDSNSLRHRLALWLDSSSVRHVIIFLIVINAIILGMETSPTLSEYYGFWLRLIDTLILSVFVLEIVLKLYAFGKQFFRSSWNIFDFL
ncbi:MAG: ion transporter, partial [Pseudomonadota bacterium]|nr:ion transporter [Pseudomonadota bacterium]